MTASTGRSRVLVTGGSRGIGRAVAALLADRGHTVALSGRGAEVARATVAELVEQRPGRRLVPLVLDVTDPGSVDAAVTSLRDRLGGLDVLVNNAGGWFDAHQVASAADLDLVGQALLTNLIGTWRVTQAMLPMLAAGNRGRIVNVSSEKASLERMGSDAPAYRVSKTALNALTRVLAAELASAGIVVHAVSPGWTATELGGAGGRPVAEGAASVLHAVELPVESGTGGFYQDGKRLPW